MASKSATNMSTSNYCVAIIGVRCHVTGGWGGGAIKYLMLTRQIENNRPIGAVCDAQVEIVRDMSVTRRWNRWRITSDCRDLWIRSWNWKNTKADSLGAQNLPHHRTKKGHTIMHRAYGCKGLVEGKGFR